MTTETTFADWTNEVIRLAEAKGLDVTRLYHDCLVRFWDKNISVEDTVLALQAEQRCSGKPKAFMSAKLCGCFYCMTFFGPEDINWLFDNGIAWCPYCVTDTVLPETDDYPISRELLDKLHDLLFSRVFP